MKKQSKKILMCALLLGTILCFPPYVGHVVAAEPPPVKIAVVDALSGAYSRNGNLAVQGTKGMMNWINARGGIKSLGGAKLVAVVVGDNKSTVEGSASAMERLCRDPEILIAQPTWGSSFSMSATEVTERLGIPAFSGGFSEKITERGFKNVFAVFPGFQDQMKMAMPVLLDMFKASGREIKTQFIASSNNVSDMLFCEGTQKYLEERGVKTVGKEIWSLGTLTDASPIMQKIKALNPDIVIYGGSALSEVQLFLMKQMELKMKNTLFLASSGYLGDPNLRFGGEWLNSWIGLCPMYPNKQTPAEWTKSILEQCRKEYSNEPWIAQELGFGMNMVPIYAEALERVGKRDRKAISDYLRKMDLNNILATSNFAKHGISFDETGRISKKYHGVMLIQWQDGECITVYPDELAIKKPRVKF